MEKPIKMDDLGCHYFWKHPYSWVELFRSFFFGGELVETAMEEAQHPNQVDMSQQGTPELTEITWKVWGILLKKRGGNPLNRWYLESSSDKGCWFWMDIFLAKMVFRGNSLQRFRSLGCCGSLVMCVFFGSEGKGCFFCTDQWIHLRKWAATSSPPKSCLLCNFLGGWGPQLPSYTLED